MLQLFVITVTLGSALLFLVQPMCARFVLPLLGGTPAVWTTCMLFFQAGLLAGYAYTHLLPRRIGNRCHAILHIGLLFLGLWFLPLVIPKESVPPSWPVWWLLGTLTVAIGLPYMLVAANAPLLQRWFALTRPGRDPYFLYAASNLGSFAGLLAYPFLLEPALTRSRQADFWFWGYVPLAVLTTVCALPLFRKSQIAVVPPDAAVDAGPPPSTWRTARWVLLAFVPSSLMLSVTHYLTADIAPIPLFWVIPLGLYLLTFVLAFSGVEWFPQRVLVRSAPVAVLAVVLMLLREANEPVVVVLGLHLLVFTLLALVCHRELARTRPPAQYLTGFYLWLAFGGVLGGLLNGVLAPLLFRGLYEYPLMLVVALLLRPRAHELDTTEVAPPWRAAHRGDLIFALAIGLATLALIFVTRYFEMEPGAITLAIIFVPPLLVSYMFQERTVRYALSLGAVLLASAFHPSSAGRLLHQQRSFFGVHRVVEREDRRYLFHGNTIHGSQDQLPARRLEPLTYYTRQGPAGRFFQKLKGDSRLDHVGLVGLGTGSLAVYANPGQSWTFFEIDPAVVAIAENPDYFTFLANARRTGVDLAVTLGDARLSLRSPGPKLGVLVLDAFGSDSIPVHLLTKEAFLEYRVRLREDGYILVNISNRYVDLKPVVANIAADLNLTCLIWDDTNVSLKEEALGKTASVWVVLTAAGREPNSLGGSWKAVPADSDYSLLRDDYANILPLLRLGW